MSRGRCRGASTVRSHLGEWTVLIPTQHEEPASQRGKMTSRWVSARTGPS